jgi:hypothetical protein
MSDERIAAYSARADRHALARDAESRLSVRLSRLRLIAFLPAVAFLLFGLNRAASPWPFVAACALFASFAALVVWHAKVEERIAWFEALRLVNVRAVARLSREWQALPGDELPLALGGPDVLEQHPYALDLDVFGHASVFQWLGPAATAGGAATLASWLLAPADRDEAVARQQAAGEAARLHEWREQFAARGVLAAPMGQAQIDRLLDWAESRTTILPGGAALRVTVVALTAIIWVTVALAIAGLVPGMLWLIPVLPAIVLWFALARPIHSAFDRAGAGQRALSRYADLFAHSASHAFESPRLADVQGRLSAGGASAYACMQRLNRVLGFAELRSGAALLHFPIQALTLWDFHVAFALERWRRVAGSRIRGWMEALAELDAIARLAWVRHDYPGWAVPAFDDDPTIVARDIAHPLIPDDRRVANDVEVGPPGTLLLVTGSNMSGKSTLLRAIGVNTILANAGSCVCASALRLPAVDLQTSIRVHDSLERGLSYFMAALGRLKAVVDSAEHERPGRVLLYLLDEILQGTNSAERAIAVRAVARHLLESGAIGAMTTHDLTLTEDEPLESAARFVHFTETLDEGGGMSFDYRLRPGVATSRNALRLMKMIGIEL